MLVNVLRQEVQAGWPLLSRAWKTGIPSRLKP
jgi:hypothetical protein